MKYLLIALSSLVGVSIAQAQTDSGSGALNTEPVGNLLASIVSFIDAYVIPLIFAIALVVFLWGVYTYLIAGGANEEKRSEGVKFIMYGIAGFAIMISVWGLVNLVVNTFGFDSQTRPDIPIFGSTDTGGDHGSCLAGCDAGYTCVSGACVQSGS